MNACRTPKLTAAALALALLATPALAAAPGPLPVKLAEGSWLKLEGKSNVHNFHSEAGELQVALSGDAAPASPAALDSLIRTGGVTSLDLSIPVVKMHSGKDGLDKNMQKALKADQAPAIKFHLTHYQAAPFAAGGDSLDVRADGTLEVAGVTKDVQLVAVERRTANAIEITGTKPLLMTDFGVKPPTMMMGALRTEDGVVIHYRLLLAVAATAAAAAAQEGAR